MTIFFGDEVAFFCFAYSEAAALTGWQFPSAATQSEALRLFPENEIDDEEENEEMSATSYYAAFNSMVKSSYFLLCGFQFDGKKQFLILPEGDVQLYFYILPVAGTFKPQGTFNVQTK